MNGCTVWFDDGSVKTFYGWWTQVLRDIDTYCEDTGLNTVHAKFFKS